MSWRDNDQPAGERDWAAAVIAAADEPFERAGSDADASDTPGGDADPDAPEAAPSDEADVEPTTPDVAAATADEAHGPSQPDALEPEPDPEFVDASASTF